jgi:hypothetical protein
MSFTDRMIAWNRHYDDIPQKWRLPIVMWTIVAIGAINMMLTIGGHFPFGLLVVLAILVMAAIRVPYTQGWLARATETAPHRRVTMKRYPWVLNLNRWYDALPESRRLWVFPAVLLIGGATNMKLTIAFGFPFGLLFLLTLLLLVVVRAPYTVGWYEAAGAVEPVAPAPPAVEPTRMLAIAANPAPPVGLHTTAIAPDAVVQTHTIEPEAAPAHEVAPDAIVGRTAEAQPTPRKRRSSLSKAARTVQPAPAPPPVSEPAKGDDVSGGPA